MLFKIKQLHQLHSQIAHKTGFISKISFLQFISTIRYFSFFRTVFCEKPIYTFKKLFYNQQSILVTIFFFSAIYDKSSENKNISPFNL